MTTLKIASDREVERPSPFAVAFVELMKARAALAANDGSPNVDDDKVGADLDALSTAEWKLLQTPARPFCEIRQRSQVVQEMIMDAEFNGRPTDNRHHVMIGVLVSEILRYSGDA